MVAAIRRGKRQPAGNDQFWTIGGECPFCPHRPRNARGVIWGCSAARFRIRTHQRGTGAPGPARGGHPRPRRAV